MGIPYPSLKDPNVALKKEYNDKKGGFNGRMWYETQAFRAVNQGLGRVVRHSKDWGALFLLESRFAERRYQSHLPQWCTKNLKVYENYVDSLPGLKKFLESHEMRKTV